MRRPTGRRGPDSGWERALAHNVNIKQLRALLTVAQTGSFVAAAHRLCVTPSALTATIQQLEAGLRVRLFDRTTRRVTLTAHATGFLAEAERLVNGLDSAVSDMLALAQGERGHIRIGAAASVISQFLVPVLQQFRRQYPHITISLRNPAAQETERLVAEGEVDFAIDSRYQDNDELTYTPLMTDTYGVVCHCDTPIAALKRPVRWSDLTWGRYVGFNADTAIGHFLRLHMPSFAPFNEDHDEVESTSYLFDVLASGDYYAVLPALSFQRNSNKALRWKELQEPTLTREICVMSRPLRALAPSAQLLLDLLQDTLQSQPMPPGVKRAPPASAEPGKPGRRAARA